MIFLTGVFTIVHVFFYLILAWKWRKIPFITANKRGQYFSVIIPARNEVENIRNILADMVNQSYSKDQFEVIVVDDFSDDGTKEAVEEFTKTSDLDLKIIRLSDEMLKGKKYALTKGVEVAGNDLILTTDADCRINSEWIQSFDYAFSEHVQIVAGPVELEGKGVFASMQRAEFAGMMAFGGVTLSSNNPSMCSGANLGFRKQAFVQVGGYEGNLQIPSGDDEFLLYDIMKAFPESGRFLKSKGALVKTQAHSSFGKFVNQRLRWVSKWRYNKNIKLRYTAVLFFADYLFFVAGIIAAVYGNVSTGVISLIFGMRFASNYLLIKLSGSLLNNTNLFWPLFALQIFYPFHVLFMGVVSIFGRYTWKGRKY
ncbi:MAG: glycosyltransferase [Cyclobacteriaceae bacterium]